MIEPVTFLKCLSDETRLCSTLLIQSYGELCVCELMEALDEGQAKVSRHLAQLRTSGILNDTRRHQWVFYSLSADLPDWAIVILSALQESSVDKLSIYQKRLRHMQDRPQLCQPHHLANPTTLPTLVPE